MTARKIKVSISVDADLVATVDRQADQEGSTRSAVIEAWLRQASRQGKLARLEEETARYYDSLTPAEREDDAGWAAAASKSARKLVIDDEPPSKPTQKSRRPPKRRAG